MYNIVVLDYKFFDTFYAKKGIQQIKKILEYLKINSSVPLSLPSKRKSYTVLRSPHIDKKSREIFVQKRFKRKIILNFKDKPGVYLMFLYLLRNSVLPGIQVKITLKNSTFFL